jgi:hypothetical protein
MRISELSAFGHCKTWLSASAVCRVSSQTVYRETLSRGKEELNDRLGGDLRAWRAEDSGGQFAVRGSEKSVHTCRLFWREQK